VGFFKWLSRLPGRLDRSMEETALASSVVRGEGMGGTQFNLPSVKAGISELEGNGPRKGDSADVEGE
jgi:hypothetical protein